ncbi:hypothetical protein TGDOM2_272020 [Toxoplasma gondii GAB2-2007-GAL-DOM2]|uniref:Uncharacterized protein n=4 Tax=Toxoplasma gondii TaxID=5811 RepID=S7WK64_TOXGG|nr:hypothetical protein TGGT1_272020 [Toxoplasma gondii GT1]KFG43324.1 hypothetical protein TGDOM2_272020 [Toxoplasma gondii GAB2-2007-GAL-DOM2]KFG50391.1 hypothetical protein TGFOU_272020 [Toxoplasma gondii FOU]PUA92263.1 hypothetical protein TGBR9_272020 [Toxoplasma gondii TgCATBr9]
MKGKCQKRFSVVSWKAATRKLMQWRRTRSTPAVEDTSTIRRAPQRFQDKPKQPLLLPAKQPNLLNTL